MLKYFSLAPLTSLLPPYLAKILKQQMGSTRSNVSFARVYSVPHPCQLGPLPDQLVPQDLVCIPVAFILLFPPPKCSLNRTVQELANRKTAFPAHPLPNICLTQVSSPGILTPNTPQNTCTQNEEKPPTSYPCGAGEVRTGNGSAPSWITNPSMTWVKICGFTTAWGGLFSPFWGAVPATVEAEFPFPEVMPGLLVSGGV